ncbi:unnamed protein product [Lactuca virosa]|uniref:Ubiquitin-like protease family profile domain-containing protein n=1 Tax=Lactuca virosa TaxID=75947 RepID=A0AAU9MKZ1_9ASTR|nr:unnamed protein product [Lactuca virosa]
MKKHATPVKKDATPVKKEAPLKEEIRNNKKEKGIGKKVDKEERNGAEKKSKKKEEGNVTVQRRWTRAQMKTRIRIDKHSLSFGNFNMQLKQIVDSAMVMYATQSGSNKRVKLNWVNFTCPVQPGSTECGYNMLRFMKEIVEEGLKCWSKTINNMQIFSQVGGGKVEYTDDDVDEIREEWSEFVTGFIYRDILYLQNNIFVNS